MFYCCICQCDGSISGLAFHEQHPNSSLCPSAPPLNILYAHLRGSSTSYCLRGYYNDKSAHCAEKGGKEKVILTIFFTFCLEFKWAILHFSASATDRLPSQFQQSTADDHLKLSWQRLDWRGGVKSWVFVWSTWCHLTVVTPSSRLYVRNVHNPFQTPLIWHPNKTP